MNRQEMIQHFDDPPIAPYTVFAWAFDSKTGCHSDQVSYDARDLDEARNWVKFNKDFMMDFVIIDNETTKEIR